MRTRSRPLAVLLFAAFVACGEGSGCTTGCSKFAAPLGDVQPTAAATAVPADPALPGLGAGDPALMQQLRGALAAKPVGYEPRTHHRESDGSPSYVNRLILQASPYLLQHAHNPVNWFPWSDEAFERAKAQDKPVLVSIGYSTCHWCHVMERESFEDEEIARYLNEHYIAIKVDREQRPDVDGIYMTAVQILTGRGGWPMTVVMTPDKRPFFGGTYFPARDGDRGASQGFLSLIRNLADDYRANRDDVVARAQTLSQQVAARSQPLAPAGVPGTAAIARAVAQANSAFDPVWGGFGPPPKFPRPVLLDLLLRYHRRTGDPQALRSVTHTLEKMAAGGVHDHLGGGFHRYSTDAKWLVPHFEKMLYDNAQLVGVHLATYQITDGEAFAKLARETLAYVAREMTAPAGGFFSATDADTPTPTGVDAEGYAFTWTPAELEAVLGPEPARIVTAYYGVTARGNFEGRNILFTPRSDEAVAADLEISPTELRDTLARARKALYAARMRRPPPARDDKIITAWNGLMISAFARGALILGDAEFAAIGSRAADFVLTELRDDSGALLRSFADGHASHAAYLDDYAFFIAGLLDLYEATADRRRIDQAIALQAMIDSGFWDAEHGGYFMTSITHEPLLAREKPTYDGAEPSGNSVAAMNLVRLAELTGEGRYRARAEQLFSAFAGPMERAPSAVPHLLAALEAYLDSPREVFIVRANASDDVTALMSTFRTAYLPNRTFALTTDGPDLAGLAERVPALAGKRALGGHATAYVCEASQCELPTSDPTVFARQLAQVEPLPPPP